MTQMKTRMKSKKEEDILPEFGGYCTSPKLFDKRTGLPDPKGIISEQIFGPIVSYKCQCGYLNKKTLDGGQTCPKCGVKCISNESRLTTTGKIKTVFPFIRSTHKNFIIQLIGKENKQLLDPRLLDSNMALDRFICFNANKDVRMISNISDLPAGYFLIPFKITGIFSLIFVFKEKKANLINESFLIS